MSHEDDEALSHKELADGLRFAHTLGMQTRRVSDYARAKLEALLGALEAQGVVKADALELVAPADEGRVQLQVSTDGMKYFEAEVEIDCAARVHLCKAKCCTERFPLSYEDLDEGVLRWNYRQPYLIRQREDGYCGHCSAETLSCEVHEKRPLRCRRYDCRDNARIWKDFDAMIPADEVE